MYRRNHRENFIRSQWRLQLLPKRSVHIPQELTAVAEALQHLRILVDLCEKFGSLGCTHALARAAPDSNSHLILQTLALAHQQASENRRPCACANTNNFQPLGLRHL